MSNRGANYTAHPLLRKSRTSTRAFNKRLMAPREQIWKSKASAPNILSAARSAPLQLPSSRRTELEQWPHMQDGIRQHEAREVETKKDLTRKSAPSGLRRQAAAGIVPTRRPGERNVLTVVRVSVNTISAKAIPIWP